MQHEQPFLQSSDGLLNDLHLSLPTAASPWDAASYSTRHFTTLLKHISFDNRAKTRWKEVSNGVHVFNCFTATR